jgi:hypothetical protein
MSIVLLLLGILVAAAGGALIAFGIPINELSRGVTLILSGSFAVVGGLLLIGLAAVTSRLAWIAALLRTGQAVHSARMPEAAPGTEVPARPGLPAREAVTPAAAGPDPEVPAIERLRSSMSRAERNVPEAEDVPLSPNGSQLHPAEPRLEPRSHMEAESYAREPGPVSRPVGGAAETPEPRIDFLFRPRQSRQQPAPQEAFDALWPRRSGRERQFDPHVDSPPRAPEAAPAINAGLAASTMEAPAPEPDRPAAEPAADLDQQPQEQRGVAILKSGVVDGMAYTLYADGSIEAQLPQGTVRFGSISELRAHIEKHS